MVLLAIHEGGQDWRHLGTADGQTGGRIASIRRHVRNLKTTSLLGPFFENSDDHETLRWLLTTKRFLMVKVPIGNGSKNATVMVVYVFTRRGKEASAQNEHIFDTVVGLAAGLGDTPLKICGDLQREPRKQSRHLDFTRSAKDDPRTWDRRTSLCEQYNSLHTHEQGDTKTRLDFAPVNEAFRAAVVDFEVVQQNLVPAKQ